MESQPVLPSTFVIERSYPVPSERVFAALSREDQKRRWYAGGDSAVFEMDFRVGGQSISRSRMGPIRRSRASNSPAWNISTTSFPTSASSAPPP